MNVPKQDDQPTPTDREADGHDVGDLYPHETSHEYSESAAKLAQPEEPQPIGSDVPERIWEEFALPTPARVEQPASEGGGADGEFSASAEYDPKSLVLVPRWATPEMLQPFGDLKDHYANVWTLFIKAWDDTLKASEDLHDGLLAPTPPATSEAANDFEAWWADYISNRSIPPFPDKASLWNAKQAAWSAWHATPKPAPVGDVKRAELPPLPERPIPKYWGGGHYTSVLGGALIQYADAMEVVIEQSGLLLRAERAAHKATREELYGKLQEVEMQMNEQEAKLMSRVRTAEAENQELRRKVEEAVAILESGGYVAGSKVDFAITKLLTAKEGQ